MPDNLQSLISAARGTVPADIVFQNAELFDPFTCSWVKGDLAIKDGIVLGLGDYPATEERDMDGAYLIPGLLDAHVHIESSLLTPREFAGLVVRHGTTTVIADPHEIANVAGMAGINYMLAERAGLPVDILYMLPSCVPATPADTGGAAISAQDLFSLSGREGVLGLGEMMNVPGVLAADAGVLDKLAVLAIRDGHAPCLSGKDLNAYILAGLQSDHECTGLSEAEEKLRAGMYIYLREGSTEQNIEELAPLVNEKTVPRCCFATDDCHADLLASGGHIDRCIRKAVASGMEPELAIRMATLSAAERFGLNDRGAFAPGRRADFCVVDDPERFLVRQVLVAGRDPVVPEPASQCSLNLPFRCTVPELETIRIRAKGSARVIGLVPHQILTDQARLECDGSRVPDTVRDILKVVVCNRYGTNAVGVGLVRGFRFRRGAIASSVAHDAHNLVAVGTSDREILSAIHEVIRMHGGMVAVIGDKKTGLPLDCGGLMSSRPASEVVSGIRALHGMTRKMGGIDDPFMYLSFLSLTVIPALRITDRGVFDVSEFRDVPLFS